MEGTDSMGLGLVSSPGRHCVSDPENPSLTETWREAFAERLSRS